MTTSALPQTEGPNIPTIAAQNDAFRKFACLGVAPDQPIASRMQVTRSLAEAEDGFMAEAVKAIGEFDTFGSQNDPDRCHDFGAVDIRGQKVFWKIDGVDAPSHNGIAMCQTGFVGSQLNRKETSMSEISILAIDLAKHSFQVCATTAEGAVSSTVNTPVAC